MKFTEEQTRQRLALLNRIKQLYLIPQLDCLTLNQIADYFEVSTNAIAKTYLQNKREFNNAGICLKYPSDFKIFSENPRVKSFMRQESGNLVFNVDKDTKIIIPNKGIFCFSRRAVVLMGMLLDGSRVASEFRNQLLNLTDILFQDGKETEAREAEKAFLYKLANDVSENRITPNEAMEMITEFKFRNFTYWI